MLQHDFILLDRSGSMSNKWEPTIGSINEYVKKLAEDNVDTGVTLATFDSAFDDKVQYDVIRDRITPKTWKDVSNKEVGPRGGTPLNDAIGKIVAQANAGFNGVQYEKVAIIIVTDGGENASEELTTTQAKQLLEDCRKKGWQVIFLGADYDNMAQAANYGNSAKATLASMPIAAMAGTMRATASARAVYGVTGQSINFTEEDKAQLRSTVESK